ncbi:MAG: trk system potassium uptake protein TrkH [Bacillota bacterium]|nr:MAG: trk system potassium uptake protein TrkH [Bacillota bacterium]MBS3949043.1 TrkH family potassium uptake protein [Peptococcaceae bacterium]
MKRRFDRMSPAQILALTFLGLILVGTLLLMLPWASTQQPLTFVEALFTATSAVCVTGLVVVDTGTRLTTFGQGVVLLLIQFGGLGLMTMATMMAIILGKRITFRERLIMQEALNQVTLEGMVRLTKYVVLTTLFFEGLAVSILFLRLRPVFGTAKGLWFSVFHSVSAFCNAGFDLFGGFRSLESFTSDITVNLVIMSLIILGGIGFSVIADVYTHKGFRGLSLHSKLVIKLTVFLIISGALLVAVLEWNGALAPYDLKGKILGSLFTSVTSRTAGYNTIPTGALSNATTLMVIVLMFIGASPGSTGGGIKTTTFAMIVLAAVSAVRGKGDVTLGDRRIPNQIAVKSMVVAAMSLGLIITTVFVLSLTESALFIDIVFEVVSAFGTVGLSRGITTALSTIGRLAIIVTMFAGRVGPMTLVLAISAGHDAPSTVRYPEGKIIVG